jgi:hypothetical protein
VPARPAPNPSLAAACGITLMVVVDASQSISSPVDHTADV